MRIYIFCISDIGVGFNSLEISNPCIFCPCVLTMHSLVHWNPLDIAKIENYKFDKPNNKIIATVYFVGFRYTYLIRKSIIL